MGILRTTEQKLDMALDELVDKKAKHALDEEGGAKKTGGYGPAGRGHHRDREGPYSGGQNAGKRDGKGKGDGKGDGKGKGKGKKRIPPEEKALLKTQCFFNNDGDLVLRLYETEVVVLKKKKTDASQAPVEVGLVKSSSSKAMPEKTSLVLVLTAGGFRTAETRSILNEALQPMALRIDGSDSSKWTLCSLYRKPGQVNEESLTKDFEDGMEVDVPPHVTADAVKKTIDDKIKGAKAFVDAQRRAEHGAHGAHHSHGYGAPPHPGQAPGPPGSWGAARPHPGWGPPPPGWGMPPPHPGWHGRPPPPHPGWAGHHPAPPPPGWGSAPHRPPPHPYPPSHGGPPPPEAHKGGKGEKGKGKPPAAAEAPAAPAKPMSDDMFQ
eukprot:TRINITY_DN8651_c1_g1_i1.p1 TRINITY_DN8651_c1_g1~~TRINITY_DN8651_c1_g1_i1.p1  ORF type:complete len:379 (-),score=111.02 TRINITY_DN8651_c1_g1_i1:84-1220(-)